MCNERDTVRIALESILRIILSLELLPHPWNRHLAKPGGCSA
jgi:hypothetical protein